MVLARQYHVQGRTLFDPARVLGRLRVEYSDCFLFAVAHGDHCFLGASPERLVRLRHENVRATCLAGSIARGTTPEHDRALGDELLASAKNSAEHEFVVRAICDALAEVCGGRLSTGPLALMKLRDIQHLFTPIVGRVTAGRSLLDLVERLHPDPAMGGTPRDAALAIIRTFEGMDRGWYAAPVGWMDARGEGEFAVAIRSALLHGAQAVLFAGCGIVAGSDPAREYAKIVPQAAPDALGAWRQCVGGQRAEPTARASLRATAVVIDYSERICLRTMLNAHYRPPSAPLSMSWCARVCGTSVSAPARAQRRWRWRSLRQPGARLWLHIDERSAGFFALGLAKAGRTPVALVCTSGTAAANFLPAVVKAWYARVPLVVLTADRPHELRHVGAPQTIDQVNLFGVHARWFVDMAEPDASPTCSAMCVPSPGVLSLPRSAARPARCISIAPTASRC